MSNTKTVGVTGPQIRVHGPNNCYKTIYPKPKRLNFSNKEVNEILVMEAQAHMRKYPDMVFDRVGQEPQKNADQSLTFTLYFITKETAALRKQTVESAIK